MRKIPIPFRGSSAGTWSWWKSQVGAIEPASSPEILRATEALQDDSL